MSSEKYQMFKQFMHNELGITKEDIREWVMEAVRQEAQKVVHKTYEDFDVERELTKAITAPYSSIRKDMTDRCASELLRKFTLVIVDKDK